MTKDKNHSEVRYIDEKEYEVNASEYMKLYSFITSWGWHRVKEDHTPSGGKIIYFWVSEDGKHKVQAIEDAGAIQSGILRGPITYDL